LKIVVISPVLVTFLDCQETTAGFSRLFSLNSLPEVLCWEDLFYTNKMPAFTDHLLQPAKPSLYVRYSLKGKKLNLLCAV